MSYNDVVKNLGQKLEELNNTKDEDIDMFISEFNSFLKTTKYKLDELTRLQRENVNFVLELLHDREKSISNVYKNYESEIEKNKIVENSEINDLIEKSEIRFKNYLHEISLENKDIEEKRLEYDNIIKEYSKQINHNIDTTLLKNEPNTEHYTKIIDEFNKIAKEGYDNYHSSLTSLIPPYSKSG